MNRLPTYRDEEDTYMLAVVLVALTLSLVIVGGALAWLIYLFH